MAHYPLDRFRLDDKVAEPKVTARQTGGLVVATGADRQINPKAPEGPVIT